MPTTADLDHPPHDPARILAAPFPERVRLLCRTWASQAHATPLVVIALYWVKYLLLYVGGWAFFVSFSKGSAPIGLFPALPLFGGIRRTGFDVALYGAILLLRELALMVSTAGVSRPTTRPMSIPG